jgi:hypothetical protein
MGRGRLTKDAKLRQERPRRGLLLSTGETTLEGEASVISRMLVVNIPPWEGRDLHGEALQHLELVRDHLLSFTVRFIQWIAAQVDAGQLAKDIAHEFEISVSGYRDKLRLSGIRQANTGRVVGNWAVLNATYRLLARFLRELDADDGLPTWQDFLVQTIQAVQQERAGQVFIDTLGQLLASGIAMLTTDMQNPEPPRSGATLVGYQTEGFVFLLPTVTCDVIMKAQKLKFEATAIAKQLKEDGWLLPGMASITVQRRVRGLPTRFWQLKADFLSCDEYDIETG